MPIKFQCAHCGAPIKAPDTHAGQTLPCPKCGQPVLVMAEPVPPPMASAPPSVAPPPVAVFGGDQEEGGDVIPEIVTHAPEPIAPPDLAFAAAAPPSADPYASPRTLSPRVSDVELPDVRVVDVRLAWGTVFWMVFQFYVCVLALSMVVGLTLLVLAAIFAAVGVNLFGLVGCVTLEWLVR